jgi:hypothetical protein
MEYHKTIPVDTVLLFQEQEKKAFIYLKQLISGDFSGLSNNYIMDSQKPADSLASRFNLYKEKFGSFDRMNVMGAKRNTYTTATNEIIPTV